MGPILLGFGYVGFKGKKGIGVLSGLHPVWTHRGPYEAWEGIYPGSWAKEKLGVGKSGLDIDGGIGIS
jgi:hypothetical protein